MRGNLAGTGNRPLLVKSINYSYTFNSGHHHFTSNAGTADLEVGQLDGDNAVFFKERSNEK